jgi:hypothetical protein
MRAEAAQPPRQVPSRQPRPRRLVRDGARPPAPGRERLVAGDAAGPGAAGRRRSATGRSHAPGRRPGAGGEPVVKPPRSSETLPVESGEVVSDPIDTRFLTLSPFGTTSFWTQPWRAYLDTWPARSLVSMVGKGMSRDYFFAAAPGGFSLIGDEFFSALKAHPGTYPGDQLGGDVMHAFSRMLGRFQGPGPTGAPQQLKLRSITQTGNHSQFTGDGTNAHPTLYDHGVLAVLPFQSSPTRFVIPFYVMTRDLLTLYEPGASASAIGRFDLPDETFRVTLANLPETSAPPTVSAYDPLRDTTTPAQLVSRAGNTAVFELAVTDYPRLLTLDYPVS